MNKMLRGLLAVSALGAGFVLAPAASAKDCAELAGMELASGKVTSAGIVPAGGFEQPSDGYGPPPGVANAVYRGLPAFCRVKAVLKPSQDSNIEVEVWLPAQGWNGKFVGIGNGVWAGQVSYFQMGEPLSRGYAVASTDTGHEGNGLTAEFAVGHPEKLVDFGHRAVHEMTVAAKQAIAAFYGDGPKLSLWNSCSTGGRQGLMEAYRYPADYDAISAMAPANPMTALMTQSLWTGYQALRSPASALAPGALALVHKAVIAQCDAQDGVEDGLVSRPDICAFDPATLLCKPGQSDACLDADQVEAMRAIHGGVRDSRSGKVMFPGFPYGSEMQLSLLVSGPEPFPVATTYMSMLVFGDRPGWNWRSFDYGADADAARAFGQDILDVPADGLEPFFARGGKLLMSHGWADGLIPATNSIAFYRGLYRSLPAEQAQQQLRLFMVPGMEHCAGGTGPSSFDTLGTIDAWASGGAAPASILATRPPAMPGAPALPPMSRPLCAWPMVAQYAGEGDVAAAENFRCALPQPQGSS